MSHTLSMSRISFATFFLALMFFVVPGNVLAAELNATPVVVDDKAKARDILKRSITIQNTSNRKLSVYPSVNDVHPEDGKAAFVSAQSAADRADSLATWIELSRGVIEIQPGEEKTVPFVIRIAANALPGTYHAAIAFGEGGDRAAAEASAPLITVTVNTEVQEDIKEFLQLDTFSTDRLFFSGDDVLFKYQLENIGNQELQPKGEVRIYDRRGEEVASIEVNGEGKKFSPDQQLQLASVWSAAHGFGRYKAFLNIDYGASQKASVQDTVFFWIIPWQQLLIAGIISLIALVFLALYFHRWLEIRHHQRFALAHGLPLPEPGSLPSGQTDYLGKIKNIALAPFRKIKHILTRETPRKNFVQNAVGVPKDVAPAGVAVATAPEKTPEYKPEIATTIIPEQKTDVIDLKNMRVREEAHIPHEGQVINLKKRS